MLKQGDAQNLLGTPNLCKPTFARCTDWTKTFKITPAVFQIFLSKVVPCGTVHSFLLDVLKNFHPSMVWPLTSCQLYFNSNFKMATSSSLLLLLKNEFYSCSESILLYKCFNCDLNTNEKIKHFRHSCSGNQVSEVMYKLCRKCRIESFSILWLFCHRIKCKFIKNTENFSCTYCEFTTKQKRVLNAHTNCQHTSNDLIKWFECGECFFRTKHQPSLFRHKAVMHCNLNNLYKCDQCLFETRKFYNLKGHIRRIHRRALLDKKYKCGDCKFETNFKRNFESHKALKHNSGGLPKFICDQCSYISFQSFHLKRHILFKHSNLSQKFKCDKCSYTTALPDSLQKHKAVKHSVDKFSKVFNCKNCFFTSKHSSSLRKHIIAKHSSDDKKLKCVDCSYETFYRENLKKHNQNKHSPLDMKYKCDLCTFQTNAKEVLAKHKALQHNVSVLTYSCDSCDFKTFYRSSLTQHIAVKHVNVSSK